MCPLHLVSLRLRCKEYVHLSQIQKQIEFASASKLASTRLPVDQATGFEAEANFVSASKLASTSRSRSIKPPSFEAKANFIFVAL